MTSIDEFAELLRQFNAKLDRNHAEVEVNNALTRQFIGIAQELGGHVDRMSDAFKATGELLNSFGELVNKSVIAADLSALIASQEALARELKRHNDETQDGDEWKQDG